MSDRQSAQWIPSADAVLARLGIADGTFTRYRRTRNDVFRVQCGSDKFVLKLFSDSELYHRERAALELLAVDALVPAVIDQGDLPNGLNFLLIEWKPGSPLGTKADELPASTRRLLYTQATDRLPLLAATEVPRGALPLSRIAKLAASGEDLAEALARLDAVTPTGFRKRIVGACERFLAELRECPSLVFGHGDFQMQNFLFGAAGRLVAILDWELASLATRWEDGGRLLRSSPTAGIDAIILHRVKERDESPEACAMRCRKSDLLTLCLRLQEGVGGPGATDLAVRMARALLAVIEGADPEVSRREARAIRRARARVRGHHEAQRKAAAPV